jgi:hypothetical protein
MISLCSCQDGFVFFQKRLNGFDAAAGIGDPDGVGLPQFVIHEQLAHPAYEQIRVRHAPKLTRFQRWLDNAISRLDFDHVLSCAYISD